MCVTSMRAMCNLTFHFVLRLVLFIIINNMHSFTDEILLRNRNKLTEFYDIRMKTTKIHVSKIKFKVN